MIYCSYCKTVSSSDLREIHNDSRVFLHLQLEIANSSLGSQSQKYSECYADLKLEYEVKPGKMRPVAGA